MTWLVRLVKAVLYYGPREFLLALLKLLFIIVALTLALLLKIWEWILEILRGKHLYPEEQEGPCGRIPEAVVRRPDPAIYSQRLLQSQGLPVTWNNPDIWAAPASNPAAIEPDSYHLEEGTHYIVSVRAHNASTDAAIGVRVRLNYRPWSFNSPDLVPVETDAGGNEVVKFVNIAPMGSAIATFNWHTPSVPMGQEKKHFCLQASLYHPLDVNTSNNMGQENTNVWRSDNPGLPAPGDTLRLDVPLFNFSKRPRTYAFEAMRYAIEDEEFELKLKTTRGYARRSPSQAAANLVPSVHPSGRPREGGGGGPLGEPTGAAVREVRRRTFRPAFSFFTRPKLAGVKNRYAGFERVRQALLTRDYSLPPGYAVTRDGRALAQGVTVNARVEAMVTFDIKVPADAAPGSRVPITLIAKDDTGVLAGGVTVIILVQE